jgi:hypothetical protein
MSAPYIPPQQLAAFCRYCEKVVPAHLARSIAGNGRIVDRESTFEYCCTKCLKSFCISGRDIAEIINSGPKKNVDPREYSPKDTFFIGELIHHHKLKDVGLVVGKDSGSSSRIFVQFEKAGLKKLVESIK